ncbi:uncharacterized protein LOC129600059 [Paramacrobiotus metropolitanus]|uniref:uncharacterized protein LOC129600059 n=1 Tax=Paramacrobiotus metropolitanus TaxID=2943436 RepID=UPI002445FE75|nr:uncharacterized protein LOC129600059 [Paramacrobiotus metropolitanus]
MTWFTDLFTPSQAQEAHGKVFGHAAPHHKASWTHELIAAAAGCEAMRAYENHHGTGGSVDHSLIKDTLAALAAAAVDRLIETHGLDWVDAQRAKSHAAQQAHGLMTEKR